MSKKLLLAMMAVVPASIFAQDANVCAYLYEDYILGSWSDWSGAPRNLSETSTVKSYDKSIRVDMRPWDFIWLHHDRGGLNTTKYTYLTFWIHGGTTGGQNLSVYSNVDNHDMPPVLLSRYATVRSGRWVQVKIPLADLQAANVEHLTGIWIRDLQGTGMPTFYLDQIRLTPMPAVTRLPTIALDPTIELQTAGKSHFGINTAFWDWHFTRDDTQALMQAAGFKFMRYPGGMASEYNWRTNTNTKDGRPGGTNTDQFISSAQSMGADMLFTTNYGSMEPADSRDWVRYAKLEHGVTGQSWCIGNEPYGEWEYDMHPLRHDARNYADFCAEAFAMMRAEDPTAKLGVAGTLNESDFTQQDSVVNPRTGQTVNGWMPVMLQRLKQLNAKPEFVEIHYYAGGDGRESDSFLMQVGDEMESVMANVRQMLVDHWGADGLDIKIHISEVNNVWQNPGKQSTSITNALFLTDLFARCVEQDIEGFAWYDLHHHASNQFNNSRTLYGWRNFGDVGILSSGLPAEFAPPLNTPYPTYYAFKLIKELAQPGDKLVEASSSSPLIGAYAFKSTIGKVRLLLLNKSAQSTASVPINLSNYNWDGSIKSWRYGMYEDLRGLDITVREQNLSRLRVALPPYSITVVEL